MYKIGTRVKKVHGKQLGLIGVVCNGPDVAGNDLIGSNNMFVLIGQPWQAYIEVAPGIINRAAGTVGQTQSIYWEPIIPDGSNIAATESIEQLMEKYCHAET